MTDDSTSYELESPEDVTPDNPFTLPGFFGAMADGELLAAHCTDCDTRLVPPRPACYACGSRALDLEAQPKRGTIVSYTEVRVPPEPFADRAPFPVAIVELDSGARLTGRVDASYDDLEIDCPVSLSIREPGPVEREVARDHEAEWPIHVFELE